MKRIYEYTCPTCGARKTISDQHGQLNPPENVPCGWRGCTDMALRNKD